MGERGVCPSLEGQCHDVAHIRLTAMPFGCCAADTCAFERGNRGCLDVTDFKKDVRQLFGIATPKDESGVHAGLEKADATLSTAACTALRSTLVPPLAPALRQGGGERGESAQETFFF